MAMAVVFQVGFRQEARASLQRSLMEVEKALVQWKAELLKANEVIADWEAAGWICGLEWEV